MIVAAPVIRADTHLWLEVSWRCGSSICCVMRSRRLALPFANYGHVLFTFEYHFNPSFWITTASSASCHPTCSTTTFCLQGQHLRCPYRRKPCQSLAGGFHSSSCHCSLLSLFSISSTFPDERPTRRRCSKSARVASNVSTHPRRWSHSCHSTSRVHRRGPFCWRLPLAFCSVSTTISTDGWRRYERCTGHKWYTKGEGETTTMGNRERGWPGGGVGAVIYGICPQPHPFPSLILSYPIPGTIMSVVLSIE